jgi:hypothetical protein
MATRIQDLFLAQAHIEVATNEDLDVAIAWYEADGTTPISVEGIGFAAIVRPGPASLAPYLALASDDVALALSGSVPRGLILRSGNVTGLYAPFTQLPRRPIAGSLVFDMIATADGVTKRVVDGTLTIIQGVT